MLINALIMKIKPVLSFALCYMFISVTVFGQTPPESKPEPEVNLGGRLDKFIPDSIFLTDEHFQKVNLKSLINKPTIISFVYYRCPGICSPLMDGLSEVMNKTDMVLGKDYQTLTISFSPTETIDLGLKKKINYLHEMKNPNAQEGWRFFCGDSANLAKATNALGFRYKRSGNDYIHAAGIIMISPEGKITRYLYGTNFLPFELKMAVIEASRGQSGPTINKVLQYCFSYDPRGQQYVLNITTISGIVILFFALIFFSILAIRPLFRKKSPKTA
jgi:protein SCO1/2